MTLQGFIIFFNSQILEAFLRILDIHENDSKRNHRGDEDPRKPRTPEGVDALLQD